MCKHGKGEQGDSASLSPTLSDHALPIFGTLLALKCHRDRTQVKARDKCQRQRRKHNPKYDQALIWGSVISI